MPPIGSDQFNDTLRFFASGVTILTIRAGEARHGLTVSAFASVSPEPPLIAVLVDQRHRGHELLVEPGATFAVNVLTEQSELSAGSAGARRATACRRPLDDGGHRGAISRTPSLARLPPGGAVHGREPLGLRRRGAGERHPRTDRPSPLLEPRLPEARRC